MAREKTAHALGLDPTYARLALARAPEAMRPGIEQLVEELRSSEDLHP